jgi:hypothetical protein
MLPVLCRRWLPQGIVSIVSVTMKDLNKSLYERGAPQRHLPFPLSLTRSHVGCDVGEKIITVNKPEISASKFY